MSQAQNSTSEQLAYLKVLAIDREYDVDNLSVRDARAIVDLANFHGLYDAADLVTARIEWGERMNGFTPGLNKVLNW